MSKIDPAFAFDAFRFIIESRRNELLRRWYGTPDAINPENSIQGTFETLMKKIQDLPRLTEPSYENAHLRYLAWIVGWDDNPDVEFIDDLSDADLRKVIQLSVDLWAEKGSSSGLVNAIRAFTGKSAVLRDYFWYRWQIGTAGFWLKSKGTDPFLVGGKYTEDGEYLMYLFINRQGLGAEGRKLLYDLLTYIRVVGEHYALVYAAFVDDFAKGWAQWTQLGTPGTMVSADGDYRGGIEDGAIAQTNFTADEMSTWTPFQRAICYVEFATDSASEEILFSAMRSSDGTTYYQARFVGNGELALIYPGGAVDTTVVAMPAIGTPIGLELKIEPVSTAETTVSVLIGGVVQLEATFLGAEAYIDSEGGVTVERLGGEAVTTYIDNVLVLASPFDVQYVGQQAIPPTPGLGGPQYIADPDPGVEPFEG